MLPFGNVNDYDITVDIPAILVQARRRLALTQQQAANICGVSRPHWGNFEIGKRIPLPENVTAIAKYLKLTEDQRDTLARTAIQHHADEETMRLIRFLERSLTESHKEVARLRVQLSDIVAEVQRRGFALPESCRDL
jgi:transcriptional regulator with XRE-family HTH domain